MFICAVSHYIPKGRLSNKDFNFKSLSEEDIFRKTGILERSITSEGENTNTMAVKAADLLSQKYKNINDIDLIIGATYTPYDTISNLALIVQKSLNLTGIRAISISSSCSSFVSAVEVAEGYIASNKANKVLIIASEHNSAYNDLSDEVSGHLWGDGASAVLISKNRENDNDIEILDVSSKGLGDIGKGPEGVYLRPQEGGLKMPHGRDVYLNACIYMADETTSILEKNNYKIEDLNYFIPHQANNRIIDNVARNLKLKPEQTLLNISKIGNTGCASTPIVLSENWNKIEKDSLTVISVFGGGYTSGSILLRR